VRVGDVVLVRPGERIPVDGQVTDGPRPWTNPCSPANPFRWTRKSGDTVAAGTINGQGIIVFTATRVGRETALAQIIRLVQEAQGSKAPIQALADRVAAVFVPAIIVIAVLVFSHLVDRRRRFRDRHDPNGGRPGHRLPLRPGSGHTHRHHGRHRQGGRTGHALQKQPGAGGATRLSTVVLDKTGTITEGKPVVTDLVPDTGKRGDGKRTDDAGRFGGKRV
jgi:Cu+-exporting ATPase